MPDNGVYVSLQAAAQGVRGTVRFQAFVPTHTSALYAYLGLAGTPNVDAGVYLRPQDQLLHAFLRTYPALAYWEDPPSPQGVPLTDTSWRLEFTAEGSSASLTATDLATGQSYGTTQPMGAPLGSSGLVKCNVSIAPLDNLTSNLSGAIVVVWEDLELLTPAGWVPWLPSMTVQAQQYPAPGLSRIQGEPPGPMEVAVYSSPPEVPSPSPAPQGVSAGLVTGATVGVLGGALLGFGLAYRPHGQPSVLDRLLGRIGIR